MQTKILAIETSTQACSVAIKNGDSVFQRFSIAPRQHAQLVIPMLEALIVESGLQLSDIDAFAFGCGPGSFTGLRIACSFIQGFAFAMKKPVIRVSSLQVLAQTAYRTSQIDNIKIYLDAHMSQMYVGQYKLDGEVMRQVQPDALQDVESNVVFTDIFPEAQDLLVMAEEAFIRGDTVSAEKALPIYLRENDAWRKLSS